MRSLIIGVFLTTVLLGLPIVAGRAEENPPSQDEVLHGVPIHLSDLLLQALDKNLSFQKTRLTPDLQQASYLQASAPFNPQVTTSLSRSSSESPTASQLAGATTLINKRTVMSLGVTQQLSWGTQLSLSLDQTRVTTNSIFTTLNPQYNASMNFLITQPLLRGFGPANTKAEVKSAQLELEGAQQNLKESEMDLLQKVAYAYWDLAFAHKNFQVQLNSLHLAEKVLHDTEIQIEVGVKAPIEKTSAEAEVALRRQQVVQARNLVQAATDNIKSLVETTEALMVRPREIWHPLDEPPTPTELPPLETLVDIALKSRAALHAAKTRLEAAKTRYHAANNGLLPVLNLVGSYSYNGLGGDRLILSGSFFNPTILGVEKGEFTDSLNQVLRGDFPSWSIGLQLTWPLNDTAAKARLLQSDVTLQQAHIDYELQRQSIVLQVRNAYRNLLSARENMEAAEASVRLQQTNLDAEQKKLSLGLSTNFIVLQYQTNLTQAESQRFQAQTDYAKAWIDLLRAIGKLNPDTALVSGMIPGLSPQ